MKYIYGFAWSTLNTTIAGAVWYGIDYLGWANHKTDWSSDLFLFAIVVGGFSYYDGLRARP